MKKKTKGSNTNQDKFTFEEENTAFLHPDEKARFTLSA